MKRFANLILFFFLLAGLQTSLKAQTEELPCNGQILVNTLTSNDLLIPENLGSISLRLLGGDGGIVRVSGLTCGSNIEGGTGARVLATFPIGNTSNRLQAGGKLRVFVGQVGASKNSGCFDLGSAVSGGGGSSAVLYLPPGADETGPNWHILTVAGGGGGSDQDPFGDTAGQGGRNTEAGGDASSGSAGNCPSYNTALGSGGDVYCDPMPSGRYDEYISRHAKRMNSTNPTLQQYKVQLKANSEAMNTGGVSENDFYASDGGDGFTGGGAVVGGGGGFHGGSSASGGGSFINTYFAPFATSKVSGIDRGSNEKNGSVLITVSSTTTPTAVCRDTTLYVDAFGNYSISASDLYTGTTSVCGNTVNVAFDNGDTQRTYNCIPDFPTVPYILTVRDSNNITTSSCNGTLTVLDTIRPFPNCKDATLYLDQNGNATLTRNDVDNGSTDNCGSITYSFSQSSFTCSDIETISNVLITITDESGNQDTCSVNVTVLDNIAPQIVGLIDTTYFQCSGTILNAPAASDNCASTVSVTTNDPISFNQEGTYHINWLLDDGNGNTTTVTEVVIVQLNTIYVDKDASAGGDGSSWALAFKDVDQALTFVSETCEGTYPEIWVADGAYKPISRFPTTSVDPRHATHYIDRNGIKLYGGFNGTETQRSQRNPDVNLTILDGDIGTAGVDSDNAYHIMYLDGTTGNGVLTSTTVIDGFTFRNGNANVTGISSLGGAIFIDGSTANAPQPIISNCKFTSNNASAGGAIFLSAVASDVTTIFNNCVFSQNTAALGGAVYNDGEAGIAATNFINCIFEQNAATNTGGAVYLNEEDEGITAGEQSATFTNCLFNDNGANHIAFNDGNIGAEPTFLNCTFEGATTSALDIVFFDTGLIPMQFRNCLFWNNTLLTNNTAGAVIQSSLVGDDTTPAYAGSNNNINQDPLFNDANNGDFTLSGASPALDVGNNLFISGTDTDLAGNDRILNGIVDMGAYERKILGPVIFVDKDATAGMNNGSSWTDAFLNLQDAIDIFDAAENVEIWVADGSYLPTKVFDVDASGTTTDREQTFYINKESIKIYGGFNGTEINLSQRNPSANVTILSGDIGQSFPIDFDNCYHVVYFDGSSTHLSTATILDGFTIQYGTANGLNQNGRGGAIYINGANGSANPSIVNCTLQNNTAILAAAGVMIDASSGESSPVFRDCILKSNTAPKGDNIYFEGTNGNLDGSFINCLFLDSSTDHIAYDDGITNSPSFINCTFSGASVRAINIDVWNEGRVDLELNNCIFWNNGTLTNDTTALNIKNSIVGNDINGHFAASASNLNANPEFTDVMNGDYSLEFCSPAINLGNNTAIDTVSTDLANATRIFNSTVDAGAYEFQSTGVSYVENGIVYVDSSAVNNIIKDGTSWATAYSDLQDAIDAVNACSNVTEIWVAKGTYLPTRESDFTSDQTRFFAFYITEGDVRLYGGFNGTETDISQRDLQANPTILSGDLDMDDVNALSGSQLLNDASRDDNAYHVVFIDGNSQTISANTLIDGFTIRDGNANSTGGQGDGGGIYISGFGGEASPSIDNCTFTANSANVSGGAGLIFTNQGIGDPSFTNCIFYNNVAGLGGAMNILCSSGQSNANFINCLFTDNIATNAGGAIFNNGDNSNDNPSFTNCTFTANTASLNGDVYFDRAIGGTGQTTFTNCILWSNGNMPIAEEAGTTSDIVINNSIYDDGIIDGTVSLPSNAIGVNNLDADPLFVNSSDPNGVDHIFGTSDDGLRLDNCSPAINIGDNSVVTGVGTDLVGDTRINNSTVDAGIYESQMPIVSGNIIYVNENASGNNTGLDWTNAFTNLQAALDLTNGCDSIMEIWVAAGTYYPSVEFDADNSGGSDNREATFYIHQEGLKIYGGFAGTETLLADRNVSANPSILDGNIGSPTDSTDNAYHVVYIDGTITNISAATVLDGFVIQKGTANGIGDNRNGGGIVVNGSNSGAANPTISNCTFQLNAAINWGGAVLNNGASGQASPSILNCSFLNNSSNNDGGAIASNGDQGISSPNIRNSSFATNIASDDGGAIYFNGTSGVVSPYLLTCIFRDNAAQNNGGAIYLRGDAGDLDAQIINTIFANNGKDHFGYDDGNANKQPQFINCTFSGATQQAINIRNFDSDRTPIDFFNTIFWDNTALLGGLNSGDTDAISNNVNIQSSITGDDTNNDFTGSNNNINQDPLFQNPTAYSFSLLSCSPGIDIGDNTAIDTVSLDADNASRIINAQVDLGAFEYQGNVAQFDIGGIISSSIYYTGIDTITTDNSTTIMTSDSVVFEATQLIVLRAGFTAGNGSDFTARIKTCTTISSISEEEEEEKTEAEQIEQRTVTTKENLRSASHLTAYPNPFNETTTIEFELESTSNVQLSILNLQGKEVARLLNQDALEEGIHQISFTAIHLDAGMYFIRLQTDKEVLTKQLIVQQ